MRCGENRLLANVAGSHGNYFTLGADLLHHAGGPTNSELSFTGDHVNRVRTYNNSVLIERWIDYLVRIRCVAYGVA